MIQIRKGTVSNLIISLKDNTCKGINYRIQILAAVSLSLAELSCQFCGIYKTPLEQTFFFEKGKEGGNLRIIILQRIFAHLPLISVYVGARNLAHIYICTYTYSYVRICIGHTKGATSRDENSHQQKMV